MSIHHEYVDIDTFLNKHIISKQPDDVTYLINCLIHFVEQFVKQ